MYPSPNMPKSIFPMIIIISFDNPNGTLLTRERPGFTAAIQHHDRDEFGIE